METTLSLKKVGKKFGERTNNLYDTISNQTTNAEITDAEIRKVILENKEVMPKLLQMIYFPTVSWQRVAGLRKSIPIIKAEHRIKNLKDELENCKKIHLQKLLKKNSGYNEKDYESKDNIRKKIADYIFKSGIYGNIMGLPHFDWKSELAIIELVEGNFYTGVANDSNIHRGASIQKELLTINGEMLFGDMFEILKTYPTNHFAHINMDFCGVLPTEIDCVVYAMQNNLVQVGGYIFLTIKRIVRFCKNDNMKEFNMFRAMNTPNTNLVDSDFANGEFLKSKLLDNYELADGDTIKYQTGSPMTFYAIKRIK